MPTYHDAVTALPAGSDINKQSLRQLLIQRMALCLASSESLQNITIVDPNYGTIPLYVIQSARLFAFDAVDATTAHDGTTCLVSADGKRYKITTFDYPWSVLDKDLTEPGSSPEASIGDAYIVAPAATGDWASHDDQIAVYTERGWQFVTVPIGRPILVEDESSFYHRNAAGDWTAGLGSLLVAANSVPLSALIGLDASYLLKVESQSLYAPPGSRATGATPTMPLGGTAANINDNSDATTATTGAIGNQGGAPVADRIVARLALASAIDLIGIEVRSVSCSSGASSPSACGLYYSTDNGANWTQLSTGFTLSTTPQTVMRTGTVAGVTDVALITSADNWGSITHTLAGLNAFSDTVTASVGTSYIVASGAIGILAGHEGKVAICEAADTLTIYTPAAGDEVYDKALGINVKWSGSAWVSAAGAMIGRSTPVITSSGSTTAPSGTTNYSYSATTAPTTSQRRIIDDATASYAAKKAGTNNLEIEYEADASIAFSSAPYVFNPVVAVYRDSEANAIAWYRATDNRAFDGGDDFHISLKFTVSAGDTSAHTYRIAVMGVGSALSGNADVSDLTRRSLTVKEFA